MKLSTECQKLINFCLKSVVSQQVETSMMLDHSKRMHALRSWNAAFV